jgi:putative hydrolase of the HAD superfamily
LTKLKAIVFDLDDTLYPERSYALSGFAAVADWAEGALGVPREDGFLLLEDHFEAGVRGDTFNRWLEAHSLPIEPWVKEMVRQYRDHKPELEPFPETVSVLEDLHASYQLALITQGHKAGQQRKLEALNLTKYFEPTIILGEDERDDWKPSAKPFERVLSALGVVGAAAAYIGDNPLKDFVGARQLGMKTVWVRRPGGEHARKEPPEPAYAADVEVGLLTEVEPALQELWT